VRILASGIDTLDLATARDVEIPDRVRDAADVARATHEPAQVEWVDWEGILWTMHVRPGAGADGPYHLLTCPDFDVRLSRSRRLPSKVTYRAQFLWTAGPRRAVEVAQGAVHALLGIEEEQADVWHVQRADLCVDAHLVLDECDGPRWRKLARDAWRDYSVGGRFTGWTFGLGGRLLNRTYLKSFQAKTKAPWIFDVWSQSPAYVPGFDVWRSEFELRRKLLKSLEPRIDNTDDLWRHQERCWRYLTARWLYLSKHAEPGKTGNGFQRNAAPEWRCLSDWAFADETLAIIEPAKRVRAPQAHLDQLLPQLRGVGVSAVARAVQLGILQPVEVDRAHDEAAVLGLLQKAFEAGKRADLRADVWKRMQRFQSGDDEALKGEKGYDA
jgi:hypothetical protein